MRFVCEGKLRQTLLKVCENGTLGVSGGSSIIPVLALIKSEISRFSKTKFILIDERDVPENHKDSNTK